MKNYRFEDLNLKAPFLKALNEEGYTSPTPIQKETIPLVLQGQDLMGMAQTGTGKTAAFTLPILQKLNANQSTEKARDPRALILAPTRELAIQINESIQKLHKILPLDKKLTEKAWLGSRPTIADSLPMIGKAPKHKNLWFNFGHNHIGLSTSAGSAVILSEMIQNKKSSINTDPFSPKRFNL